MSDIKKASTKSKAKSKSKTAKKATTKKTAAKKSAIKPSTKVKKTVTKKSKKVADKKIVKKTAIKKTENKNRVIRKKKRKVHLQKLCTEMNKMSIDAVDKEIIKRLKIIVDTCDEDISKASLDVIIKEYESIEYNNYHESLHPYIKHYIFMVKRSKRNQKE